MAHKLALTPPGPARLGPAPLCPIPPPSWGCPRTPRMVPGSQGSPGRKLLRWVPLCSPPMPPPHSPPIPTPSWSLAVSLPQSPELPGAAVITAWGEFEGFQESSSKSEQFFPNFERPERPPHPRRQTVASTQKERGSRQPPQGGPGMAPGAQAASPCYEDVFRFVFQEVPAEQATEGVSPLDSILEPALLGSGLASESRRLWRALQNTNSTSASRCLWSESRCQENLFLVLGIDAAWKSLSGDPGHTLECSDLKEPEELGVPTFRLQPCRALIQTKLSGTSGGRQGSLLACSLFLKTPLCRNGQHITVPWKKKIFSPRNLKMTLFNSDIC
uniref:Aftiphilin clathrin-binding box domain-containing protein n=1 Tax=Ursus maritimus TaxID=29073 RepID=A0A452VKQ7_URSMA